MTADPQLEDTVAAVAAERTELARILSGLSDEQWEQPSLCAGWRVREVVAHLTMPFRYPAPRFVAELARSGFRFHRMADRVARRDARAAPAELAAGLRDNIGHPWSPPGGGRLGALTHDVVHGLDLTTPLGIDPRLPAATLRLVLDSVTGPRALKSFGTDLSGIRLQADDLDWSHGSGAALTGPATALILAVCGRRVPGAALRGEPAAAFAG